jgi:plastocyanin
MKKIITKKNFISTVASVSLTVAITGILSAQPVVTINTPEPNTTAIIAGGTVSFAATRNSNAANWPGGNGVFTYTWNSTGPAPVIFTPATSTGGTAASTVATFSAAGTYTITCTGAEGGGGLSATSLPKTVNVLAALPTAANLWATSSDGNLVSSFIVASGAYIAGPATIFDPFPASAQTTAALGRNAIPSATNGHFYWLPNNTGNSGTVTLFAATATGGSITNIGTLDLNGASANDLGFVRLGIGPDGRGWILAGDGTTVYLAKFTTNGVNPVTITLEDNNGITLNGGAAATFQNGDICISGTGLIYALANNGSGVTQIFTGSPAGNTTAFTKKWDLVDNANAPFTGRVNGVAFDLFGSLYISTDNGLFFIDQNTVNGPAGTVQCLLTWAGTGLQDLASNVFPSESALPVRLESFTVSKQNNDALLKWTTSTEVSNDRFEIERSEDAINFSKKGSVAGKGNSNVKNDYQFTDILNTAGKVVYYRLKTVDIDGKENYSKIISLRLNGKPAAGFSVYPNPFVSDLKVNINSEKEKEITIRITSAAGQEVLSRRAVLQPGDNIIVLSELTKLKPGTHLLEIIEEGKRTTQKIIKK